MRAVTREAALAPDTWTPQRAAEVEARFDTVALSWDPDDKAQRLDVVHDALERGPVARVGVAVDLGAGTGLVVPALAGWFDRVFALDLSREMLIRAPAQPARVQADAAHLPLREDSVDAVVLVNSILFAAEARRVLRPGGALVWVCTLGADTPIYLSGEEVDQALGGTWSGVESEAGWGTWAVFTKPVPEPGP